MPLNQFKTQVLLLHSEQSTLETLSSGFGDRYTVHCATSGSEALNTLTETPINIIVTAQDLPGMSGLEALREAKKRSPETIGILLAGNSNQGLEALVGAEEVFQVVRGNVTTDSIKKLVDNATQQMRLMALAESANDMAANVDEPAEHIVMETSENGSTIISGGTTGRMPALNPEKLSAAAAVGAQSVDVLVLTKDQEFLTTIKESSRGMHTVHYANTLKQADELIREHQVGVAVVDAAMVGEKVEQLTQHLRRGSARLVSIVAGRRDDGEMLMDLINRGKVYRFLLKPVSPGRARLAVESSVKHHLEAPDAAFKIKGGPAPAKPAATPPPKPAAKTAPAPQAKPKPAAKPAPKARSAAAKPKAAGKPAPTTTPAPADPPLGNLASDSPVNEGLSSAFGDDDSSFTQTMTGLINTVTKKISGDKEATPKTEPAVSTPETLLNLESPAGADSSGGSLFASPKVIGIAGAAVMVVAAALFWFMSGSDETAPVKETLTTSTPSITRGDAEVVASEPDGNVAALVDEARLARDAGQIFNPAGSNALELFVAAVQADPSNATLAAELDAVVGQALGMAETALLEANLDDASAALQRVAMADPDNVRLPFMSAQLTQMQLRGHLDDARAAIRDTRFEDAANALAAARALGLNDATEIDAVAAELSSSRSEQRADEVLALATARLEEGDLLAPANDNARYYYELVLSNDPQNTSALQGLNIVASRLVLQARAEIDAGNLDAAEGFLADARAIDASSSDLGATETALIAARDAVAASERRALERRRQQEADRIAAEQKAEEERQAAAELAAQQAAAELAAQQAAAELAAQQAAAEATAQETAPEETPQETVADEAVAEPVAAEAQVESEAGAGADTEQAAAELAAAEPAQRAPVAISSLNRVKYVAPKYPRAAQRRGDSGWVDIVFTVGVDGAVSNVEVRKADPEGVFDSAAIRAVEKWKFEPVSEDGRLVEVLAGVRMMFALEN